MIPVALRITNFRSFRKTQEFKFPEAPGLYFMQGLNEAEPQLEGNGAGKSTIWEALTWLVYGKTSRGLKAGDVGNWEAEKDSRVEFDFIDMWGLDYTLARNWKPNHWRLYPTATPEEFVDLDKAPRNAFLDALGLEFTPWLHAIVMAQNQPMFLDLKAEAKASLFSEVMGLDSWLDASAKASKLASAEDMEVRRLERREAELLGSLQTLEKRDYSAAHKEWLRARDKRLDEINAEWASHENYSTTGEDLKAAEAAETRARQDLRTALNVEEERREDCRQAERELGEIDRDLAKAEEAARHAENHLVAVEENEACSQCGARLSAKSREKHLAEAEATSAKAVALESKLLDQYGEQKEKVKALQAALRLACDSTESLRRLLRKAEDAAADARRNKLLETKQLDALEDEAERLEKAISPYADLMAAGDRQEVDLKADLKATRRALDDARFQQSVYAYWVRGFKEIRLQQISEALTELEIEVNSAVSALGLIDWELRFTVDRETAKGTLQRGFNVTVLSPHNERPVPWEAWSGGESQRLRLAANMGLADLIRARTGTTINLEVWDEPTQGLSPKGVADLLECLASRAKAEGRQIWIVDHRSYEFGGFAGTTTIVKAPSGSRIRQSKV